jgi:hypothetical protein
VPKGADELTFTRDDLNAFKIKVENLLNPQHHQPSQQICGLIPGMRNDDTGEIIKYTQNG